MARHYEAVADASPIPVVVYNVPKFTGVNIAPATVARVAPHPNIIGVKDSAGDIGQIVNLVRLCPPDFDVVLGNAPAFLAGLEAGAVGGILALANVAPRECVEIQALHAAGRHAEAHALHARLMATGNAVTGGYGIAGLKAALDLLGYRGGPPRPPLPPADAATRAAIRAILAAAARLERTLPEWRRFPREAKDWLVFQFDPDLATAPQWMQRSSVAGTAAQLKSRPARQ
jgi:4-hydroxy-2-oxoglutarate aldolase